VVALYALANKPLGVSGSYLQVLTFFRNRPAAEMWRVWFFVGIIAGGALASILRGGPSIGLRYGALGLLVPVVALIPILFVAGVLMGYGARWAGGCTSGHGLNGSSILSPASLVATLTFMATAIGVTMILHVLTGGAL
jgi:uncharacterized membrane protein YedE/YeeE